MEATQNIVDSLVGLPVSVQAFLGVSLVYLVYFVYTLVTGERPVEGFPVVDLKKELGSNGPAHSDWSYHCRQLIQKGLDQVDGPFQILTGTGYKVMLPNRFAHELRNHPDLSFAQAFKKDLFIDYPGFDAHEFGLRDETFIPELVRIKLTQSLGLITDDLVEEADDALQRVLGDDKEWTTRFIKQDLLDIVARLSARVFNGKPLCRNPEWLSITKSYTVDIFMAATDLRACYPLLRPIQYWFMPRCQRLRKVVRDARRFIGSEMDRRVKEAEKTIKAGGKSEKTADAIGWMVEMANGRKVDYTAAQLSLGLVAIHTTSETSTNCIMQLCETPEIADELRKEIVDVLKENGWSKISLYKMKLLDSFLKEVQRTNALANSVMNRLVTKKITLSDGSVLKPGTRFMVMDSKVSDPSIYPEPAKFDVGRFMRLREEPGAENRHQFVTPTTDLMGFGYGQHACPGRFFVSNEMKIALCFLLLRYDFRYDAEVGRPEILYHENAASAHPLAKVQVRRRKEEIDLLNPQA